MHPIVGSFAAQVRSLMSTRRQVVLITAGIFTLCLLTVITAHHRNLPASPAEKIAHVESLVTDPQSGIDSEAALEEEKAQARQLDANAALKSAQVAAPYDSARYEPRVAYSADLGVITKDFVRARSSMEDILDRHRGYATRFAWSAILWAIPFRQL